MGDIVYGVDFRKKKFDNEEMVKLAKEVMGLINDTAPSEIVIYESSLGYVAPESDPA